MDIKSFHGYDFFVAHFPGQQKITQSKTLNMLKEIKFHKPDNISIISIMTPDIIDKSPLHYQLVQNGIEYVNPVPKDHKMWINKHKPRYIVEALKNIDTKYCLILDGNDTAIVRDLDDMAKVFECYEKAIVFNSTSNRFPNLSIDHIEFVDDNNARPILFGPFCYLNAGVCFGYTPHLLAFYEEVVICADMENVPSEQYYVRKVMGRHQNEVFFDYDCRLFQAFNKGITLKSPEDEVEDLPDEIIEIGEGQNEHIN